VSQSSRNNLSEPSVYGFMLAPASKQVLMCFPGLILLVGLLAFNAHAQALPDFAQADAMLELLRACHSNHASQNDFDRVTSLAGTELVVAQQNISRRVMMQQYRDLLAAACAGRVAHVDPAEPGARAEKGVQGLTKDVAPSIIWGRDHIPLLESRVAEIRRNQSIGNAISLAREYLPIQNQALQNQAMRDQVALNPKLYVVMGGRAGAAAIDNQLYYDVLIMEWRVSRGEATPRTPQQVVEFFAHETHHLGYGQILDRKKASLNLSPAEAQVWNFLVATLMEGSATLLINGHGKLEDLQHQPDVQPSLAKAPELLPKMQKLLRATLTGPMTDEAYAEASSPFLDMGYHASGAVLLAAIEKKRGLAGVMEVMADPRQLLAAYNGCAEESSVAFKFDPVLADRITRVGEKP
jgi:hypothetical protein